MKKETIEQYDQYTRIIKDEPPENLGRYITRKNFPAPLNLLPGIKQLSPKWQSLLMDLSTGLNEEFPASDLYEHGAMRAPGIPDGFQALQNLTTIMPNPRGVPPEQTDNIRRDRLKPKAERNRGTAGYLATLKMDMSDVLTARAVTNELLEAGPYVSIPIDKYSSTGLPFLRKDLPFKAAMVEEWERSGPKIMKFMMDGKFEALYADYRILIAYILGYRVQPDRIKGVGEHAVPAKIRTVDDWNGHLTQQDRNIGDTFSAMPGFFRGRSRQISQSPAMFTLPIRAHSRRVEHAMMAKGKSMFKFTSRADLARALAPYTSYKMIDFPNHDQLIPPEVRDIMVDWFREHISEPIGEMLGLMYRAPMFVKNDYEFKSGAKWRGNPFDRSTFTANYVNTSGIPTTSLLAKLAAIVLLVIGFNRAGKLSLDQIPALFRHELDYAFFAVGDNVIIAWRSPVTARDIDDGLEAIIYSDPEPADTFMGWVPAGDIPPVWYPNPVSYILRWLQHDKDLSHPHRRFWAYGWFLRKDMYFEHPVIRDIDTYLQKTVKKHFGYSIDEIARAHYVTPTSTLAQNVADVRFLLDPASIFYAIEPEDVTPDILQDYYVTVTPERAERIFGRL